MAAGHTQTRGQGWFNPGLGPQRLISHRQEGVDLPLPSPFPYVLSLNVAIKWGPPYRTFSHPLLLSMPMGTTEDFLMAGIVNNLVLRSPLPTQTGSSWSVIPLTGVSYFSVPQFLTLLNEGGLLISSKAMRVRGGKRPRGQTNTRNT